jgi:hypothetical protein
LNSESLEVVKNGRKYINISKLNIKRGRKVGCESQNFDKHLLGEENYQKNG